MVTTYDDQNQSLKYLQAVIKHLFIQNNYYLYKMYLIKSEVSEQSFYFNIINIEGDNRKTLMMRNIPNNYTKQMLIMEIDPKFKNKFDYFNLPFDGFVNPGYAFINLKSKSYLKDFYNYFNCRK